ncbi:CinA family protein [Chachezhania antarctica]|uniref:CinA family protein n=1 Tax=Chachezhania antarctica TaxID=2340860 RepID=UPI000EAD5CE2|nr:CinA family protein [Chachezhania antarctica]|tara:strand:+ start:2382 stop:2876 length:495 start_codon:yes stop_codon:yes gene_type:complete
MTRPGAEDIPALLEAAKARGIRIATAESCTGGMVASALIDVPGSSAVVERGFVVYSNAAKREMLGVTEDTLEAHGAVSEETAREMADGALKHSHAQLTVAITGIAGPGGSEHKPEGRVCFAVAYDGRETITESKDFGALGRAAVRAVSRDHALNLLAAALTDAG